MAIECEDCNGWGDRERFVTAWVAETGIHPSEAQMVITETWDGPTLKTQITIQRQPQEGR